ncbi:MAG TPA: HlyD family efflux transporter periplasmic adaptor subunit [Prolixibacteraceae bacterium]
MILIPVGILVILTLIFILRRIIPKAVKISDCITLTVEQGEVFEPIIATGTVEAENEVLIRCPYSSFVKQIIKEPGSRVLKGDVIVVMEDEPIKEEIDKINDQLELKRNTQEKNKLSEFSTNVDLNYSEEVKKLNITSLKAQLADEEQLLEVGGISPAKIEKTKQEIALAEKDLVMLKQKNSIRLKQLKAEEQGLNLGIKIQEKELADKVNTLSQMHLTAPSNGIILSVSNKVGEKADKDKVLVRMSDLSTFKIAGLVDDKLADYIKTGKKVYVVIDSERLPGIIGNVAPTIENNKIQFNVHLEEKNNPKLISNQNIILWVVGNDSENTLRIKNLNMFEKEVPNVLYVLKDGEAVRREIKAGIKNPDYIQILSGLEAGEKVIIPKHGISAFHNSSSVVINN